MALVTGALGSVIPKLALLLKDEYELQKGVRKKITCLSRDLESMHAALRKVAEVPPDQLDDEVKLWVSDVREMSYDAEDILDTFQVCVEGHEAPDPNRFKRAAKKISKLFSKGRARRKIAGMVKIINEQADLVAERHRRYKAEDIVARPAATGVDPRLAAMYKEVTRLVGIEKPSDELISLLSPQGDDESKRKIKVVSVVGTGGLGKTTIAKAVYEKLKVDFECTAFVPIGRSPDLNKVFREVLIDLDKIKYMDPKMEMLNTRQLIDEVREYLGSRRYFIVIDDIWETESWELIKLALVQNANGSRVITTTRKLGVAIEAGDVYKLQPLSYDASKKLFDTRIFGAKGKCPANQLDEVSEKILKKCDGVPLAIITMASLLVGKSREEWIEVCNSIAFRNKDNKQVNETEWILALSYYDLPPHLKTCFLYLSLFPEDYIINKDSLIWQWVAEGFIHKKQGTGFFEAGEGYFYELINRSMLQAVEIEENGMVYGCHVHDMVLDLLRDIAQKENFVAILNDVEGTLSSRRKLRRLAMQKRMAEQTYQDTYMDLSHVRSFMVFKFDFTTKGLPFLNFGFLRILVLEGYGRLMDFWFGLDHLENLIYLRYLKLSSYNRKLPDKIGALKCLQTLDVQDFDDLPSSIGLLTQLICLRAGSCRTVPVGVIGMLTSLEELQICAHDDSVGQFLKELGKLPELRVLTIDFGFKHWYNESMQPDLVNSLGNLCKIRHLELKGHVGASLDKTLWDVTFRSPHLQSMIAPNFHFSVLPSYINPSDLPNLTHLELCVYNVDEQVLKILGGLPQLLHLRLDAGCSVTTVTIHAAGDGFFQKLRSFSLPDSTVQIVLNEDSSVSLTLWSFWAPSFGYETRDECRVAPPIFLPQLQVLQFQMDVKFFFHDNGSCEDLDLGLQYLRSLQKVKVSLCCYDAFTDDVELLEVALRYATEVHPNKPTLQIGFDGKGSMKSRPVANDVVTEQENVGSSTAGDDVF